MKKGLFFLPTSFRIFYIWLLRLCFLYFSLVAGTQDECPVQLNPQRVVVKFGSSVSANCSTTVPHQGMGWEVNEGGMLKPNVNLAIWRVTNMTEWEIEPFCYINHKEQCKLKLPVTVYKTPDSVSISTVNHTGPMTEENQYELQCDVLNVAPAQNLIVKWYKGETLVNQTVFTDTIKTPVSKTTKLRIRPDRADDGVQYRCEAELELGAEGPQPPPNITSNTLRITVHYKPIINETKLPSIVPVFRGYPEVIVCEAEGNPKPTIHWNISTSYIVSSETLTINDSTPQDLYCIANNSVGTTVKHVKVSKQEIFISIVNHTGLIIADKTYVLQCDVHTMAETVVVRWYRRQHLVNQTIFTNPSKTSVRKTSKLLIRPDGVDDGVQYRCEAELKLGAEGSQPKVMSQPLNITAFFKPIINETKLLSEVPVFRGYPEVIVCEAEGNPKPTIHWNISTSYVFYNKTLTITESTPEDLYCVANNSVGTTIKYVKVVLKEDYLPIIAGLVAITVAFISVIFIFIYSIYYKTAKMGRYSLKDAKSCAQNGNIAQNGKNNSIPMKKLSVSNIIA